MLIPSTIVTLAFCCTPPVEEPLRTKIAPSPSPSRKGLVNDPYIQDPYIQEGVQKMFPQGSIEGANHA